MSEKPPLPPPNGSICPNCGAGQGTNVAFCTNCGAPLQAATSGAGAGAGKILISLALAFGAVIFGALGGCIALIGVMGGNFLTDWPYFVVGVAAVLAAIGCVWGLSRMQRRK